MGGGILSKITETDVMSLLTIPDHLRETMIALQYEPVATAETIAHRTHRARAVESMYLNHLTNMGLLKKERRGKRIYFILSNARTDIADAYMKLKKLNVSIRKIVLEDTMTALQNRIKVMEKVCIA